MASAEGIYDDSFASDQTPPGFLDAIFVLTMLVVHTVYILKFTAFSLKYQRAKIFQRKHKQLLATSILYYMIIHGFRQYEELLKKAANGNGSESKANWENAKREMMEKVDGTEWRQLRILRWILRIGMGVTGMMLFILFIICQINIIYEYLVLSVLEGGFPLILAVLMLPFWTYCTVVFSRWILSGVSMMWEVKIDRIADDIAMEDDDEREIKILEQGVKHLRLFTPKRQSDAKQTDFRNDDAGNQQTAGNDHGVENNKGTESEVAVVEPHHHNQVHSKSAGTTPGIELVTSSQTGADHDGTGPDYKKAETKESAVDDALAKNDSNDSKDSASESDGQISRMGTSLNYHDENSNQNALTDAMRTESEQSKNCCGCISTLEGFCAPFFMAMHWRLWNFGTSIAATVWAMPYVADEQFTRLFVRYMLISAALWMGVYFTFSLAMAICARCGAGTGMDLSGLQITWKQALRKKTSQRRLAVSEEEMKRIEEDCAEEKDDPGLFHNCARIFCFKDDNGHKDPNSSWTYCKFELVVVMWSSIVALILARFIIADEGFLMFAAMVLVIYYFFTLIMAQVKPHGIYSLCKDDQTAMKIWKWDVDDKYQDLLRMKNTKHRRLSCVLGSLDIENKELITVPSLEKDSECTDCEKKRSSVPKLERTNNDAETAHGTNIFPLIFETAYVESLETAKASGSNQRCKSAKFPLDSLRTLSKQFKAYWIVLLPYRLEIRPFAVCFSGNNYLEDCITSCCCTEDAKEEDAQKDRCPMQKCIEKTCRCAGGFLCAVFLFLMVMVAMVMSYWFYSLTHDDEPWYAEFQEIYIQNATLRFHSEDSLPICEQEWNGNLSAFDLTVITEMAYGLGQPGVTMLSQQEMMCLYFDTMDIGELRANGSNLTTADCSWQIVYETTDYPFFMHFRNDDYAADVIAIRGTYSPDEMLQDFVLYNQVAMLQIASWTIPMTTILPRAFIANLVYTSTLFDGIIDQNMRSEYDEPIYQYVWSYLESISEPIDSLYFAGHSLGGGLAKIVAAQIHRAVEDGYILNENNKTVLDGLEVKSFALASPGLSFGARKFSVHIEDIYATAMEIRPEHDRVSSVDDHIGQVAFVECPAHNLFECHLGMNTICQMMSDCNAYRLHHPDLVATWCDLHDSAVPLMNVWNMTSPKIRGPRSSQKTSP